MKKILLFSVVIALLYSCKQSATPKETAQQFLKAIYTDVATAASLATSDTKAVVEKIKNESKPAFSPEESFQLTALTETVSGNNAEVKNDVVNMALVKEDDGWKVVANEKLLSNIQNREALLATAQTKWEALLNEYEARLQAIKAYVNYKKGSGQLSTKAQALNDVTNSFATEKAWTKEKILTYMQKQQQLSKVIEDALEPSLTANTDLSMTYFLQITHASDRIKAAESDYQLAAEQAHSPVYVSLPSKAINASVTQ